MTTTTMAVEQLVVAGQSYPAMTTQFPVPFTVVRVNPVKPEFTIAEQVGDVQVTRVVKLSLFAHAVRVVTRRSSGWSIHLG